MKRIACGILIFVTLVANSIYAFSVPQDQISYYFTRAGQHPDEQLVKVISSAKCTLDMAIYSISKDNIVKAVLDDQKRGVKVRIITDRTEARTKAQLKALQSFKAAKIPIKINSHTGLMHLKMSIVDNSVATSGSYNYSEIASKYNDEVLLIIRDKKVASDFEKEFQVMWADTKEYKDY